jgi:hypothetical protein
MPFAQSLIGYGVLDRVRVATTLLLEAVVEWARSSPREPWLMLATAFIVTAWFWYRPRRF